MAKIAIAVLLLLCSVVSFASDPTEVLLKDRAKAAITIQDDAMETQIQLDTANVWKQRSTRPDVRFSDVFLRGWINKSTGEVRAQVYYATAYQDQDWWHLNRATFEAGDSPMAAEVYRISSKVESCSRYRGCDYIEQVGFDVPLTVLRLYALRYTPEDRQVWWKIRLRGKSSDAIDIGIPLGEVAAFVERIEELRPKK